MADTRVPRSSSPMPASASAVSTSPATAWLTPERVAHAEFRSGFRGLDAAEVRSFLARVAGELRTMLEREAELVAQLERAEERNTAVVPAPLDIRQVTELLGQETARVLETAREAAADIKARAESDADATRQAAAAEAERVRNHAESLLAERSAEADAVAAEIEESAQAKATQIVEEAEARAAALIERADADAARAAEEANDTRARATAEADAARESARDEGRRMVAEARAVRERILTDMARRRNVARQQLERVRAARERLLEAIDGVRQSVSEAHAELSGSLVEAKLAGERGARTVDVEDLPPMRELDAEVELAKDTGLVDVSVLEDEAEDLSPVDTGEFAAVTAPEPAVEGPIDADATPGGEIDGGEIDGDATDAGNAAGGAPGAAEPAAAGDEQAGDVGDAEPSGTIAVVADADGDITVVDATTLLAEVGDGGGGQGAEPEVDRGAAAAASTDAPATGESTSNRPSRANRPRASRLGNVEVVPLTTAATSPSDAGGAHAPETAEADVRSPGATPASTDDPTAGDVAPTPSPSAARKSSRRAGPKKTEELFARLRGSDDSRHAAGADRNGKGAAAVIGVVVEPDTGASTAASDATEATDTTDTAAVAPETEEGAGADEATETPDVAAGEEAAGPADAASTPDPDRVALHTRDAVLAGTVRDLSRQLKLALSDQQNELLEAGRTGKGRDTEPAARLDVDEMAAIYVSAAGGELATAWSLGRRALNAEDRSAGTDADVADLAQSLGRAVVEALRQRLDTADLGDDEPWPVERVRAAYREVRSQRLNELVEYHVYSAYAAGQLAAAPAGSQARWVCDTCGPDCLDNALASPLAFGEAFPTGHLAPPAFAGCRCVLVPAEAS